jgi:hypothetical protein
MTVVLEDLTGWVLSAGGSGWAGPWRDGVMENAGRIAREHGALTGACVLT